MSAAARPDIPDSRETIGLLRRALRYIEPFRARVLVKLGLGLASLVPLFLVPWPAKFLVDQVIEGIPIGESLTPIPFFVEPFIAPLVGASTTTQVLWIAAFQVVLLVLVGAIGTSGRESDHTDAYLSSGHDTATTTENEANAGFSMAGGLLGYFDFRWTLRLTQDLNHHYRTKLFERIQSLPISAFDDESIGDAVYRVMYDAPSITNGCFRIILTPALSVIAILCVVGILDLVFGSHPEIVWSAFVLLPLVFFGTLPFASAFRRRGQQSRVAGSDTTTAVEEGMSNILAVQSLGSESRERDRFDDASWQSFGDYRAMIRMILLSVVIILVPTILIWGNILLYTVDLVIDGGISRGDFLLLLTYFGIIAGASVEVGALWFRVQGSAAGLHRVFQLMDLPSEDDSPGTRAVSYIREGIRLEDVSFSFPDGKLAVDHVDLDVRVGKVTALVGPAGAGKSTLAYLACGYLPPSEGRVLVDGTDSSTLQRESLRTQIAFVFQETALFDETIAENIRLGKPDASDAEVQEAARIAGADEFIRDMPDGYETRLGRAGGKLSVGQKQRLSIARALVRGAPLLVLDEPTSALDTETENRVIRALQEASRSRAVLVIAHRLSSIRKADEIIYLDRGRVVERGTHADLMRVEGGAYRRFVDLQSRGAD